MQNICIGVDIGLTKICASFFSADDRIEVFPIDGDDFGLPAYIRFRKNGDIVSGKAAKLAVNKKSTIFDIKKIIGKSNSNNVLQKYGKHWSFPLTDHADEITLTKNSNKFRNITDIQTLLVQHLIQKIEDNLKINARVTEAVISVPSQFNYQQITETIRSIQQCGIEVKAVLNESTASALTYMHCSTSTNPPRTILFFDMGGGKLDVSIATIERKRINIISTAGDNCLGGRNLEDNVYEYIVEEARKKLKLNAVPVELTRNLKLDLERITKALSTHKCTKFTFVQQDEETTITVTVPITRNTFERINEEIFQRCLDVVNDCLRSTNTDRDSIKLVVLSGGSSKIPRIKQLLQQQFSAEVMENFHMETAACYGNSVYSQNEYSITEIVSKSLGVLTHANIMDVLIPRNTKMPITGTKLYLTTIQNQPSIIFPVLEGESIIAAKNNILGEFSIPIPANKPPGYPVRIKIYLDHIRQLQIAYEYPSDIDSNHIYLGELSPMRYMPETLPDLDEPNAHRNIIEEDEQNFRRSCSNLVSYCTMIETLFSADKNGVANEKRKHSMLQQLREVKIWIAGLSYTTLLADEVNSKLYALENSFEPILRKYGHSVKDMNLLEFFNYIMNKNYVTDEELLGNYVGFT